MGVRYVQLRRTGRARSGEIAYACAVVPYVALNGSAFFYDEAGAGEPLLLLHGGLGTGQLHWWRELPFFGQTYRTVAPDLRGYGRSAPPRDFPADFYQRDAADMAALIQSVFGGPSHVLGWSDGGVVALIMAVEYPELVHTLTAVSAEAHILPEEAANWPALMDTSGWSEGALRRFIAAQGPLNWPEIVPRMLSGYQLVLATSGGHIVEDRLSEIRCPTLILHGMDDPTVPVSHAYELHKGVAGSTLYIYPGTGHLPQREHEADFRARVLRFLGSHPLPDRP